MDGTHNLIPHLSRPVAALLSGLLVGVLAFFGGFGFELADVVNTSALTDALMSGVEAVIAALLAALGTWAVKRQATPVVDAERPPPGRGPTVIRRDAPNP